MSSHQQKFLIEKRIKRQVLAIMIFLVFSPGELLTEEVADLPDLVLQSSEKSHTEIVTKSPHAWQIYADPETPVQNQYIQIEVSEGTCRKPVLRSDKHVDFSSLESIVKDVITPEMSQEEKAIALWRFVMENCYLGPWGTSLDGLEHLNVYGYGYCGTFAAVLEPLWWTAGLKARHVNTGNHAATEVYYDNDWHYLDAHRRCFFLEKDNRTIASLEDLNNDPGLWDMGRRRKSSQKGMKKYYYMTMHPQGHGRSLLRSSQSPPSSRIRHRFSSPASRIMTPR